MIPEHEIIHLCKEYGTPLYIYSADSMTSQIEKLQSALSNRFNIYYSMKANPNPSIIKHIFNKVSGVEVCSIGELYLALHCCNIAPENILFVGPGKSPEDLTYAIRSKIRAIIVESHDELKQIQYIAERLGVCAHIALRINPEKTNKASRLKMGGVPSQFGIDEELIPCLLEEISVTPSLSIVGFHVYAGTQIVEASDVIENMRYMLDVVIRCCSIHKILPQFIDFGGGFSIAYYENTKEFDLDSLRSGIKEVIDEYKNSVLKDVQWLVESGRYIVAESGIFVTRVLYKKHSRGRTYVIVDGGSNFNSSSAGIGRIARGNFPITLIRNSIVDGLEEISIVGNLCTPTDVIADRIELPKIEAGDLIVVHKSGAYGLSASTIRFLSHLEPGEVLCTGESIRLIKRKGKVQDLLDIYRGV